MIEPVTKFRHARERSRAGGSRLFVGLEEAEAVHERALLVVERPGALCLDLRADPIELLEDEGVQPFARDRGEVDGAPRLLANQRFAETASVLTRGRRVLQDRHPSETDGESTERRRVDHSTAREPEAEEQAVADEKDQCVARADRAEAEDGNAVERPEIGIHDEQTDRPSEHTTRGHVRRYDYRRRPADRRRQEEREEHPQTELALDVRPEGREHEGADERVADRRASEREGQKRCW